MKVSEVMTPIVESVHPDTALRDASEKMQALDMDPLPVTEGDRLVGVVTHGTLQKRAEAAGLGAGSLAVRSVMDTQFVCCCAEEDLVTAARHLGEKPHERLFSRLPVVDRENRLVGAVSVDALRRHLVEDAPEAVDAIKAVESIAGLVSFEEDKVDFMSDESFPASDPPPPPANISPRAHDDRE
jgi:CBS domain-containing protein